jgi:hypothetical protein
MGGVCLVKRAAALKPQQAVQNTLFDQEMKGIIVFGKRLSRRTKSLYRDGDEIESP